MKTSQFLLAALTVLTLASCQRETNDTPPPPQDEVTTKMLIYYKYYDNGAIDHEGYIRWHMDTVANILYKSYDTVTNLQHKYIYDDNDRLVKIVYAFTGFNQTPDSVIITRPSLNTVVFKTIGADYTYTAVTTDLGAGRKKIHIETASGDPTPNSYWVRDLYMSADGKLDSAVRRSYSPTNNVEFIFTRRITYNASGTTLSIVDVWDDPDGDEIWLDTHTITRDNNDNTLMENYVKNRWGSDLAWAAYNFEGGLEEEDEIFNDFYMTDNLMVMKGSILKYTTNSKVYKKSTGAFVRDDGSVLSEYPPVYYSNGRLKSTQEIVDGEIQKAMDLKYYN